MQIQKETSKISVKSLCEDMEPYAEATFSPLPGIRRKSSHRQKRSSKTDHLIRLAYYERVHLLVKPLALTSIPPLRKNRVNSDNSKSSTVNAILEQISVSEKEYDFSTEGNPLEIFLSLQEEENNGYEPKKIQANVRNKTLPRPISTTSDSISSITTHFQPPFSVSTSQKKLRFASEQCTRLRRKPFYSHRQPCVYEDHPLIPVGSDSSKIDQENSMNKLEEKNNTLDFNDLQTRSKLGLQLKLMTSFHRIKFALNSVSSHFNSALVPTNSSIPTKSADTDLSQTSECLPLNLEYVPTTELRWYLNPITNAPIEEHPSALYRTKRQQRCLVCVQMQTYKISASNEHSPHRIISHRTKPTYDDQLSKELMIRRRDMRENCDFLRVAVMEMLMRRRGKLDNQVPGKARLVLPPRTLTIRPPEITDEGIPVRWISLPV